MRASQPADSLNPWFVDSLNHWIIGSLIHWFIGSLTHTFIGSLDHWFSDSLVYWFVGSLTHWIPEIDSLIYRFVGSLVAWFIEYIPDPCDKQPGYGYLFVGNVIPVTFKIHIGLPSLFPKLESSSTLPTSTYIIIHLMPMFPCLVHSYISIIFWRLVWSPSNPS